MEIRVIRQIFNDDCTIGTMTIDGEPDFSVFSLEDAYREIEGQPVSSWKIQNMTAIPKGRYQVDNTYSNHFSKYLPLIENVPGFTGVRIHGGNTSGDTEGCILLGMQHGDRSLIRSQEAMQLFIPYLHHALSTGDDCFISIS